MQARYRSARHRVLRQVGYVLVAVFAVWLLVPVSPVHAAETARGSQLYLQHCASCHGEQGQGSDDLPDPLVGILTLSELTEFIDESMPEEAPEECVGEEAALVARYIYDRFYSESAQARNRPSSRVQLTRMTVRQYRHAVADLLASFRSPVEGVEQPGLSGAYFASRRPRREPLLTRVDPNIHFDFGTWAPAADGFDDPHQFSIRWTGSLVAPETGLYEFIMKSNQSARVWLNDTIEGRSRRDVATPLIDGYVKSGDDDEYTGSIYLLAGRAYPLRVELSKAKQGVDDSDENPPEPTNASIRLSWKPPHRVWETVPQRQLTAAVYPEQFVVRTPFPPDDRSEGYERGTSISKAWDEATTGGAIEVAGYVVENMEALAGIRRNDSQEERDEKLQAFCRKFVRRAFRRPLNEAQQELYIDRQFAKAADTRTAVKRVVMLALKSPRFLYHDLSDDAGSQEMAHRVAERLSFGLWDSLPDAELTEIAATGRLMDPTLFRAQAERMVKDRRARAKLMAFFLQWLKVEDAFSLVKNPDAYPDFDEGTVADLRTSLRLLIDSIVYSDDSDFRRLLLDDSIYLNGRLAQLYGVDLPGDAPFQRVKLDSGKRAGVLTHPYLLANFAYTTESSPIHRGVFLARNVLGRALRPPAEAFTPLPADLHPELTTRERVALQTRPKACLNCHGLINPLGFTLESFDAIGRYRDKENGRPVDTTGGYKTVDGEFVSFGGVRDLAHFLATEGEESHRSFVARLFHYLVKQPIDAFGVEQLERLRSQFAKDDFHIRKLMVEMMSVAAFRDLPETNYVLRDRP